MSHKTKRLLITAAATVLVTGLACAQDKPPAPPDKAGAKLAMLAKVLDMTPAQVEAAKKIIADEAAQVKSVKVQFEGVSAGLKTAIRSNDVFAIEQLAQKIGAAHGQVTAIQAKSQAAFLALLTPEQIAKLDALADYLPAAKSK